MMGQLGELLNIKRRAERRREELARIFDKTARELNLAGASPEELREELNRLIDYPYGIRVGIIAYRGSDGYLYAEIPKESLQKYLGQKKCIFEIGADSKRVYREYGPDKERHKHSVPEWIGGPGEKVEASVRKINAIGFLEAADKAGLPFKLKIAEGGIRIVVDSREIQAKITEFGWEPGGATVAYAKLLIKDYLGNEHVLKIEYEGYGIAKSEIIAEQAREILAIHYNDPLKELVLTYKKGTHERKRAIALEYVENVRITKGNLDSCEGYVSTDLFKEARGFSSFEKGKAGCKIAEEVLRKSDFKALRIATTSNNIPGQGDKRFDIFDVSGYSNHEFIGCEVKLTTVSELDMRQDPESNRTKQQLLAHIATWNDPHWRYRAKGDPAVKKGLIISIYIDRESGQFKLVSKGIELSQHGGEK